MSQPSSEALQPSAPTAHPTDPLAALRHATQTQHARLDAGLAIAQPHASLTDYAHHAAALNAWLAALAPELHTLQMVEPHYSPATDQRLAALQADLQDIDPEWAVQANTISPATQIQARHALQQAAAEAHAVRWGMAYVVEGSQLGGVVLHRQLSLRLSPHPLRYLQGRGADTGTHWKAFMALLRTHLISPAAIQAACQGAQAAFEGLQQHLSAQGQRT